LFSFTASAFSSGVASGVASAFDSSFDSTFTFNLVSACNSVFFCSVKLGSSLITV